MTTRNLFEVALEEAGEVLLVQTLSPYIRRALYELAEKEHPDPDPTPYVKVVENAAVPMTTPAADNPDYVRAKAQANVRRLSRFYELMIDAGCVVDIVGGIDAALARYTRDLAHARKVMQLTGERNDFLDLVKFILIRSGRDASDIANCANNSLTQAEVLRGLKSFQYSVERDSAGRDHYRKITPGAE